MSSQEQNEPSLDFARLMGHHVQTVKCADGVLEICRSNESKLCIDTASVISVSFEEENNDVEKNTTVTILLHTKTFKLRIENFKKEIAIEVSENLGLVPAVPQLEDLEEEELWERTSAICDEMEAASHRRQIHERATKMVTCTENRGNSFNSRMRVPPIQRWGVVASDEKSELSYRAKKRVRRRVQADLDVQSQAHAPAQLLLQVTGKQRPSELLWEKLRERLRHIERDKKICCGSACAQTETLYASFARQINACECADKFNQKQKGILQHEGRVFSYEGFETGRRLFLAADLESFLSRYWNTIGHSRHCYEIIRQGHPCRLYLDVEYEINLEETMPRKQLSPEEQLQEGDHLVDVLITILCKAIKDRYGIKVDRNNILEMDSSTRQKFSRHLVFHLKFSHNKTSPNSTGYDLMTADSTGEYLFRDNEHVGAFVKSVVKEILMESETTFVKSEDDDEVSGYDQSQKNAENEASPHPLWLRKNGPPVTSLGSIETQDASLQSEDIRYSFLADLAVYTRNRAFRLYGSRKFSRGASKPTLWCAKTNKFRVRQMNIGMLTAPTENHRRHGYQRKHSNILKDSLVVPELPSLFGKKATLDAAVKHGFVRIIDCDPASCTIPLKVLQGGNRSALLTHVSHSGGPRTNHAGMYYPQSEIRHGQGHVSPFPVLDSFVVELVSGCRRGEKNGKSNMAGTSNGGLRSWKVAFLPHDESSSSVAGRWNVSYEISHYRYCERIGRAHQSNHIKINITLHVTTSSKQFDVDVDGHWRQGCHDPECRDFLFQTHLLPLDLLGQLQNLFSDFQSKEAILLLPTSGSARN